jgi:hypothetical protein
VETTFTDRESVEVNKSDSGPNLADVLGIPMEHRTLEKYQSLLRLPFLVAAVKNAVAMGSLAEDEVNRKQFDLALKHSCLKFGIKFGTPAAVQLSALIRGPSLRTMTDGMKPTISVRGDVEKNNIYDHLLKAKSKFSLAMPVQHCECISTS